MVEYWDGLRWIVRFMVDGCTNESSALRLEDAVNLAERTQRGEVKYHLSLSSTRVIDRSVALS